MPPAQWPPPSSVHSPMPVTLRVLDDEGLVARAAQLGDISTFIAAVETVATVVAF